MRTTIRKAVKKAYDKMPEKFSAPILCKYAQRIYGKPVMDGTTLRRLRELRADGICVYKVWDSQKAIYQKVA